MRRRKFGRLPGSAGLVVFAAVVLAIADFALARAGGGGGYSGGHSSGGGSRSGGGGGGGGGGDLIILILQLLQLCIEHPFIGIPIVLLIIAFFVYAARTGNQVRQSSVIRKANLLRDKQRQPQAVAILRANDPAFNPDGFLTRVRGAFLKIQQAWADQKLTTVQPFISDGVAERFSLQFDEQKSLGYRNRMEQVQVTDAVISHITAGADYDELAVRIEASARDQNVSLKDGKVISGKSAAESFTEIWSFLRRRGARTSGRPGLMEGNCPNCGAPISINQAVNCEHCGASLRSGQFDWVLAEITQECEWSPHARGAIPGLGAVREADPAFSTQDLEDRASVIFWRKVTAERTASIKPLRKVALPAYCDALEPELKSRRQQAASYVGECAVGSVDLLGVLPPGVGGEDSMFRALLEVKWSGRWFSVDPAGTVTPRAQSAVFRTLLVLVRDESVKTNAELVISSAHCPNCGAPDRGGSSGVCESCGVALNDGSQTWALAEAVEMVSTRGQQLLGRLRAVPVGGARSPDPVPPPVPTLPPAEALAWMVKMAQEDGVIEPRERELLEKTAARYGLSDRLQFLLQANGSLELPSPRTADEGRALLTEMARVALADGSLSSAEQTLLTAAGQKVGLSDHDVTQLLRRVKKQLFAQAQVELRAAKRKGGPG